MHYPIIHVFAYQEALLIEAVFGIAVLTMLWIGFGRWLQYKERIGHLTAERSAQQAAQLQYVEARLEAIERLLTFGGTQLRMSIDAVRRNALS